MIIGWATESEQPVPKTDLRIKNSTVTGSRCSQKSEYLALDRWPAGLQSILFILTQVLKVSLLETHTVAAKKRHSDLKYMNFYLERHIESAGF